MSTHVLVMAKTPVPGRVKTRLCPPCTPAQAAEVAGAALHDTLAAVVACGAGRAVLALDGEPGDWIPEGVEIVAQVPGSLGERLAAAWGAVGGPGLQIGMDTPQVTGPLLDRCLAALLDGPRPPDAVLGDAEDGGWWAVGLHRPHPGAFDDVPMSRPDTGRHQRRRLRELGLRVASLPVLRDMDTMADAVEIGRLAPATATARVVARVMAGRDATATQP
jgi:glycosyltransferase A (GT-A) superfamily protein (DUF2064 family)